jgi:hypothetical protein
MNRQLTRGFGAGFLAVALALCINSSTFARQTGGTGTGTGGTQQGGQTSSNAGGVEVDAQGVLRTKQVVDPSGKLSDQRKAAARAILSGDVMKSSELRYVCLNRLEKEVEALRKEGKPLTEEMLNLAGLTRITHVFYLPESKDIVLAGPAEGFYADPAGRVVGMESGQAVLQLQDLIVALRAFQPGSPGTSLISCSIDPTQEGLARLQATHAQAQAAVNAGRIQNEMEILRAFRSALGMHNVTVKGVSPKTHFAQVMVEADYRMKLIGIGLERPAVPLITFIAKADPSGVSKNALQRWYFQPNYDCVQVSADGTAMQLVGTGVKLVGENERIDKQGQRSNEGKPSKASRAFCESFTKNYDALAKVSPVFAELRNLMDMTIAAAFIHEKDLFAKSGWNMSYFADESRSNVESYNAIRQVEAAINAVWKDGVLMTPIGGGVAIQPHFALDAEHAKVDEKGEINKVRDQMKLGVAANQWWWD